MQFQLSISTYVWNVSVNHISCKKYDTCRSTGPKLFYHRMQSNHASKRGPRSILVIANNRVALCFRFWIYICRLPCSCHCLVIDDSVIFTNKGLVQFFIRSERLHCIRQSKQTVPLMLHQRYIQYMDVYIYIGILHIACQCLGGHWRDYDKRNSSDLI